MREYYNKKECIRFANKEPRRVTIDHPLLGQHVVLGSAFSMPLDMLKSQISRLLQMRSCNNDPDFWRIIKTGVIIPKMRIPGVSIHGFRGVRKLVISDQVDFADEYLLRHDYII